LLGTTREFLDYFGLKSLDDLPTLAQLRDIETLGVQLEFGSTPTPEAADAQAAPAPVADGSTALMADATATRAESPVESVGDHAEGAAESGSAPVAIAADAAVAAAAQSHVAIDDPAELDDDADGDEGDERESDVRAAGLVACGEPAPGRRDPRD
jgi:segregation and condensation protein B